MAIDPAGEISELKAKLASVEAVLEPETMRKEADGLRVRAGDPGLWEDQEQAQAVTRRLSYLDGELARLDCLARRLDDTSVMFELAESENDEPTRRTGREACGASTYAGPSGTATRPRSTTRPTRKRPGSSRRPLPSRPRTPTAPCAASTARTGWSASPSTTTRDAGRPRSPGWT